VAKCRKSADMVGVEVSENDPSHPGNIEPCAGNLSRGFIGRPELESCQPKEWIPAWEVAGSSGCRRLPGIDQAEALRMLDQENVDGQRLLAPVTGNVASHTAITTLLPDATCRKDGNPHLRY
jgi:hypothetical protein